MVELIKLKYLVLKKLEQTKQEKLMCLKRIISLIFGLAIFFLMSCGSSKPVTVNPILEESAYSEISCLEISQKFYVVGIRDKRGYASPENIGFTQTGLSNKKTSILSDPVPTEVLKKSLSQLLNECESLAAEQVNAQFLLNINLLSFQITEVTKAFSETITASIEYEVVVLDQHSDKRIGRFTVEATDSEKAIDTSKFAGQVAKNALRKSYMAFASELEKTLNSIED